MGFLSIFLSTVPLPSTTLPGPRTAAALRSFPFARGTKYSSIIAFSSFASSRFFHGFPVEWSESFGEVKGELVIAWWRTCWWVTIVTVHSLKLTANACENRPNRPPRGNASTPTIGIFRGGWNYHSGRRLVSWVLPKKTLVIAVSWYFFFWSPKWGHTTEKTRVDLANGPLSKLLELLRYSGFFGVLETWVLNGNFFDKNDKNPLPQPFWVEELALGRGNCLYNSSGCPFPSTTISVFCYPQTKKKTSQVSISSVSKPIYSWYPHYISTRIWE